MNVMLLATLLISSTVSAKAVVSGKHHDAEAAYVAGDYDEALRLLLDAQVSHPKDRRYDLDVGNTYYRQGNYAAAAEAYARALAADDPALRAKAGYNLGNARFRAKKYEEAVKAYEQALKLTPKDEDARYNLAVAQRVLQEQKQQQQQQGQQQPQQPSPDGQTAEQKEQSGAAAGKQQPGSTAADATPQKPVSQAQTGEQRDAADGGAQRLRREEAERYLQQLGDLRPKYPRNRRGGRSRPVAKDW